MHHNKVFDWANRAEMLRFADDRAFAHIFTASEAGLFVEGQHRAGCDDIIAAIGEVAPRD